MGRTVREYSLPAPSQELVMEVQNYLSSEGYKPKLEGGEEVYQKGSGLMMGPTFIKFTMNGNIARVEAWMKYAILPGVYGGEIDLDSFVGAAVKGPLKSRMAFIESRIMQHGGVFAGNGFSQIPVQQTYYPTQSPVQPYQSPVQQAPVQQPAPQNYYQPPVQQPPVQQPPVQSAPAEEASAEAGPTFCSACGAALNADVNFCSACGAKVQ